MTYSIILLILAILTVGAQVGTQPPTKALPATSSGSSILVCHYDSNDSTIHLESKQPDQAPVDRGPATEGRDTLPDNQGRCIQPEQNPTDVPVEASRTAITPMLPPVIVPQDSPTPEATPTPLELRFPETPTPTPETIGGQVPETPTPEATPTPEPTPIMPPVQIPGGGDG